MWAKHMRDLHSTKWTQQVHKPVIWRCDLYHAEEIFTEEETFEGHLNSRHADCSAAERKAISRSSRNPRRRRPNICPLCGYDVSAPTLGLAHPPTLKDTSPHPTKIDESVQLNKLARHIAGHLRGLAFHSSNNLGPGLDKVLNDGDAQHEDINSSSSVHSLHHSLKDGLAALSLRFDDAPDGRNLGAESYDIEYSDYEPVESPPEQGSLSWVQSWITWKEEHDGLHKTSAEMDHIIGHLMAAKFNPELWDQAYNDLKNDDSALITVYERILSYELNENSSSSVALDYNKSSIDQIDQAMRRSQMGQLVHAGLKKIEQGAQVKQGIENAMHVVLSAKDIISSAIQTVPQSALAWTGVCFALQVSLCLDPVNRNPDSSEDPLKPNNGHEGQL